MLFVLKFEFIIFRIIQNLIQLIVNLLWYFFYVELLECLLQDLVLLVEEVFKDSLIYLWFLLGIRGLIILLTRLFFVILCFIVILMLISLSRFFVYLLWKTVRVEGKVVNCPFLGFEIDSLLQFLHNNFEYWIKITQLNNSFGLYQQ